MEQRLRSALPPRTAWIVIGACIVFWTLSAFGLLQLPASVPSLVMFFWLYLNALAALLSAMALVAAVAALVLHRRESLRLEPRSGPPSALDAAEETNLHRMLTEDPPVQEDPGAAKPGSSVKGQAPGEHPPKRTRRKRRRS